jgi:hypothetical protein
MLLSRAAAVAAGTTTAPVAVQVVTVQTFLARTPAAVQVPNPLYFLALPLTRSRLVMAGPVVGWIKKVPVAVLARSPLLLV